MQRRDFMRACAVALASGSYGVGSYGFGSGPARIRLITRGDDLGCAHSLNRAMKECYEKGVLKNCSVLAASPYIEEGARMLARLKGLRGTPLPEWVNPDVAGKRR